MNNQKSLVYLAVPYSHPDEAIRLKRFHAVNHAAAKLMRDGVKIFSPISHTHPIAMAGTLPTDWDYWEQYDRAILGVCNKLIVLKCDGWDQSKGVMAELAIAKEIGIEIEFLEDNYGNRS